MKISKSLGLLLASLALSSCAADPVSYAAFGVAGAVASGISRTVDATRSPEERIRRRLPPNCSRFRVREGSMECVAFYPRVPSPFAISSRPPEEHGVSTGYVSIDRPYAECLFTARVEKRGKPSSCRQ